MSYNLKYSEYSRAHKLKGLYKGIRRRKRLLLSVCVVWIEKVWTNEKEKIVREGIH